MTQQKLIDSVWEKFSDGDRLRYLAFCDAAKAYADAETKELEEAYAELKSSYEKFYESDAVQHKQILALNAEIKRLREGVEELRKLGDDVVKHVNRNDLSRAKMHASRWDEIWNKWRVYIRDSNHSISPAPVTEDKFSVSAYPKECVPTIEQLTETDDLTMMQRLEKRMPPFHGVNLVTVQYPNILQTILALPDDTSAAYIKSVIHDQLKRA